MANRASPYINIILHLTRSVGSIADVLNKVSIVIFVLVLTCYQVGVVATIAVTKLEELVTLTRSISLRNSIEMMLCAKEIKLLQSVGLSDRTGDKIATL